MPGVILMLLFLAVIGPIGLFLVGAIWSGISGWALSDDADNPPADGGEGQASS